MIQDTTFVVDVIRGDDGALARLDDVESRNRPEKLSAVTVLELYEGIQRSARPGDETQAVLDVLDSKTIVPADHAVMRRAGEISGTLFKSGSPIDREDCVIAATALLEDESVLTRNEAHFHRVQGLDVVSY